ncbi:hypothetical protein BH11MYX1_BH11MYX1_20350 [soil metagenome]
MKVSIGAVVYLAASASVASAEPPESGFDVVLGVGFPAGGAGVGYHTGRVEVLVEGEAMILGAGVGGTATIASNIDLMQRPRYGVYLGALATVVGAAVAGYESGDGTDAYLGGGVVTGFRLHGKEGSISHAFEVGLFDGHCVAAPCMDGGRFVTVELAYRVYFHQ